MKKYTLEAYAQLLQNARMMKEFYSCGKEDAQIEYLTYDSCEGVVGT